MNVLVTYATRLGSTREIAERIAARLESHDVRVTTSPVDAVFDVAPFDAVVIGTALYAGHALKGARKFVRDCRAELGARPVWVFSSGPVGDFAVGSEPVVPREVTELLETVKARGHRTFAGALDRSAIDAADFPVLERIVAKRFVPEGDWRDWAAIDGWADAIARELTGVVPAPAVGAVG